MAETTTGRHGRSGIVDTALRLLDAHGLPDLTMRRLAAELDVRPSALYWHFDSKQMLLAAVADRIVAGVSAADPGDAAAIAHALRASLLAHRDGAEVVLSTQALALGADEPRRLLSAALRTALHEAADRAASVVLQFTLGHASLVQQRIQAARFGAYDAEADAVAAETEAEFDEGLRLLLRGVGPRDADADTLAG